jgi:hypothetical protein
MIIHIQRDKEDKQGSRQDEECVEIIPAPLFLEVPE